MGVRVVGRGTGVGARGGCGGEMAVSNKSRVCPSSKATGIGWAHVGMAVSRRKI